MSPVAQLHDQTFASIRMAQSAIERSADARLKESLARLRVRDVEGGMAAQAEHALDAAMHVALAQMGTLHLADATGDGMALATHAGFERRFVEHFAHVSGPSCACGWALRHRQRIVVPDIGHGPLFYGARDLRVALDAGVRAVHATPLIDLRNRVVGVLTVHFGKPHTPSAGDLSRMDTLALVVANRIRT